MVAGNACNHFFAIQIYKLFFTGQYFTCFTTFLGDTVKTITTAPPTLDQAFPATWAT